jgi:hypothetical protein
LELGCFLDESAYLALYQASYYSAKRQRGHYIQLYTSVLRIIASRYFGYTCFTFKEKKDHSALEDWLRIALRYFLAFVLFTYGFFKIFKLQFPTPDPGRLTETYRDSTPMGLA